MAAPEISASTTVNAPASKVWQRVTDLSAMGKRSPQWKKMILLPRRKSSAADAAPAPGTVTINFNRQGILWWPTWAVVTEVEPEKVFEFKIPLNGTRWRFEISPHRRRRSNGPHGEAPGPRRQNFPGFPSASRSRPRRGGKVRG